MLLQNLQGAQFFLDTVFMLLLNHFTFFNVSIAFVCAFINLASGLKYTIKSLSVSVSLLNSVKS